MFKKAIAITAFIITLTAAGCAGNGGEAVKEEAKYNLIVNNGWGGICVYSAGQGNGGLVYSNRGRRNAEIKQGRLFIHGRLI